MKVELADWQHLFHEALKAGVVDSMIQAIQTQATSHAGTANAKVKREVRNMLTRYYVKDRAHLYDVAQSFCRSPNATAQEIGVLLLADFFVNHPDSVNEQLQRLANSENWEVREWVASACGQILEAHFELFYPILERWSMDDSENVRRAAVLALMYAGKSRHPMFADPILNLIERFLSDSSKYVRENVGPFAIGSALIRYYPEQVLDRMQTWVQSENEYTRWNIAMVFSAAASAPYALQMKPVMDTLTLDDRPLVKRAVTRALKNIKKRCPEYFL